MPRRPLVALVLSVLLVTACTDDPKTSTPRATPNTTAPGVLEDVSVSRLDDQHLLVGGTRGSASVLQLLEASGSRRTLRHPGGHWFSQAFVHDGAWYTVTQNCASNPDLGNVLYRSTDSGASWSRVATVGYVGCHAGDHGEVQPLDAGWVFVSSSMVGEGVGLSRSPDGVRWSRSATQPLWGGSTVLFAPDGSYVRLGDWADRADLHWSDSLDTAEHLVALPDRAVPVAASLGRAGDSVVLLGRRGQQTLPYVSLDDGRSWTARAAPFRAAVERSELHAVTERTWWARAFDGKRSVLAVTDDAGSTWRAVPVPPGPAPAHPFRVTAWNATSVVVDRGTSAWITVDRGKNWNRF